MGEFKNNLGKRKIIIISVVVVLLLCGGIFLFKNGFLNNQINGVGKNAAVGGNGDVATDANYSKPDGKITAEDSDAILKFSVRSYTPTTIQKERADVDGDGKITSADARIVSRMASGTEMYGDVNKDGKLTKEDIDLIVAFSMGTKTPTEAQKNAADIDGDGKITSTNSKKGVTKTTDAMVLYNFINKGYGDVATAADYTKKDGKLTKTDAEAILKFAVKSLTPTAAQKRAADVTGDGGITPEDARIVLKNIKSEENVSTTIEVTFNKNGSKAVSSYSRSCKVSTAKGGESCKIKMPTITPQENQNVYGWATTKSATAAKYKVNDKVTVSSNQAFYAVVDKKLKAYFYIGNADAEPLASPYQLCSAYGENTSCNVVTPMITAKDGYVSRGWSSNANSSESKYLINQTLTIKGGEKYYAVTSKSASSNIYQLNVEGPSSNKMKVKSKAPVTTKNYITANNGTTIKTVSNATDGSVIKKFMTFTSSGKMQIYVNVNGSAGDFTLQKTSSGANDFRIKLDYLYFNSYLQIQAHAQNTILFYVQTKDTKTNKIKATYGPYGVYDYKFKGDYVIGYNKATRNLTSEGAVPGLYYNYEVISEKLSVPSNEVISNIVIEPFSNANSGVSRQFALGSVSVVRYNSTDYGGYTKANALYKTNFNEKNTRTKIVNSMYDLASIKWVVPTISDGKGKTKLIYGNVHASSTNAPELVFKAGETIYGIPYGNSNTTTIEKFAKNITKDKDGNQIYNGEVQTKAIEDKGRPNYLKNLNNKALTIDCGSSVGTSIQSNIPGNMSLYNATQWLYNDFEFDFLGNMKIYIKTDDGQKTVSLNDYIHYKDKEMGAKADPSRRQYSGLIEKMVKNKATGETKNVDGKEVKVEDGSYISGQTYGYYDLYAAYASAKPADIIVESDGSGGHVRLVSGITAHVVCRDGTVLYEKNSDGYGLKNPDGCKYKDSGKDRGGIDPDKSYLILTDITSSVNYVSEKDGEAYTLKNNRLSFCRKKSDINKTCDKTKPEDCGCFGLEENGNLNDFMYNYALAMAKSEKKYYHTPYYMVTDPKLVVNWTPNKGYTDLTNLSGFDGKKGNWAVNHIHTFTELRMGGYLPVTMRQYSKSKIEQPYAYIINPNTSISDVLGNGFTGTIALNYELKKLTYKITHDGTQDTIVEYVDYNLIESNEKNMYSFLWRKNPVILNKLNSLYPTTKFTDEVGDKLTELKNSKANITQIKIEATVGGKTITILSLNS